MVVLAVLVPAAVGGLSFVWCAPMARALLHTCCPASAQDHGAVLEAPCCEGQRVATLASFRLDAPPAPWVPPPMLVALIALAVLYAAGAVAPGIPWRRRATRARAGPSPPLFLLHRSLRN